jgi:long-chain acyl-CoA synthetase
VCGLRLGEVPDTHLILPMLILYSPQWLALFHGAASQSIPIVTAYSSLGVSGLQHAVNSTKAAAIFVDPASASRLQPILKETPSLRVVVYGGALDADWESFRASIGKFSHIQLLHYDELCTLGRRQATISNTPSSEDLCAIFYTSGSTGTPKGVPMKHKNVVAAGNVTGNLLSMIMT